MENQINPVKFSQSESNNENSQKRNLFLIIAIIIGVVAIGAVGFASWKYFSESSELEKEKSQPSSLPEQEKTIPQVEEQEEIKKEEIISSKKVDETADWKIFTNQGLKYSFKYPQDWELEGYYLRKSIEGKIYGTVSTQFSAWENFEKQEGKITFEEYVEKIKNEHSVDLNVKNFKDEKILLGKKEGIKFSYEIPDREISIPGHSGIKLGELVSEVYVKTDKGLLYIIGTAVREKEIYSPIVNQILSTFKFTE